LPGINPRRSKVRQHSVRNKPKFSQKRVRARNSQLRRWQEMETILVDITTANEAGGISAIRGLNLLARLFNLDRPGEL
jgi:hypothetical protein